MSNKKTSYHLRHQNISNISRFLAPVKSRWQFLSESNLWCYIISCLIATTGGGLSYIATTWLVLQYHSGIHLLAITSLCFWLPGIFLAPVAGVCVDRYDRKKLYIAVNVFRAIIFIIFGAILKLNHHVWWCYLLAGLNGATFPLYAPLTSSLVREIVSTKNLLAANASIDAVYEVGNICGMGVLAAILLSLASAEVALIFTGLCLALSAVISLGITRPYIEKNIKKFGRSQGVAQHYIEFKQGLQYICKRPKICFIYSIQSLLMMSFLIMPVLLGPFAKSVLHANGGQFGWLEAGLSFGVIGGSIIVPFLRGRFGFAAIGYICVTGASLTMAWFALNQKLDIAYIIYILLGFFLSLWAIVMTEAQKITALSFQGRTQSFFNLVSSVGIVIIYLLIDNYSIYIPMRMFFYAASLMMGFNLILLWMFQNYTLSSVE